MEFILGIVITIDASKRGGNIRPPTSERCFSHPAPAPLATIVLDSQHLSTNSPQRIPPMWARCIKGPVDCIQWHFPPLWYVDESRSCRTDPMDGGYKSDSIAFTAIITAALKSKAVGTKVSVILATIVEDSTRYFLVIFASQFVFIMTLTLGRVSVPVPLPDYSRCDLIHVSTAIDSNSPRAVSCQPTSECSKSHRALLSPSLVAMSCTSFVCHTLSSHFHTANGRSQVSSCDDWADYALAEESCK